MQSSMQPQEKPLFSSVELICMRKIRHDCWNTCKAKSQCNPFSTSSRNSHRQGPMCVEQTIVINDLFKAAYCYIPMDCHVKSTKALKTKQERHKFANCHQTQERAKPREPMALLLLPFFLLLSSPYVQAQQNITLGSSLTPQGPSSFWLSPSGDFAFGFLPIEGNTSSYLLAVWFNKISDKTIAWYAKTTDEDPSLVQVSSSSQLQLTFTGALSLQDPAGTEVWNPTDVGAVHAAMLDSGNFILAAPDGSTKWETFKNPADTILLTQVLNPGTKLRSRILPKDYSNGRFLLNLQTNGAFFYPVSVPSGYQYDSYWSVPGNSTTNLVFNATGAIYITLDSGMQNKITSGVISSMADYYHRATLDPDGVFRQYMYPKKVSNLYTQAWSVVDFKPPNICSAETQVGSGICGFNSYCTLEVANNQTTCECPSQYSFIDEERKYKGCKQDFQPQSCDLDEAAAMMQYQLIPMSHVDWPKADYEQYSPITEDQCRHLCLIDCFCAVAVFNDNDNTCWKKKMPLSNGIVGDGVQRTVFIKVPKNNNPQSELTGSSKWRKDKKYWILGSSLLLGSSFLVNIILISVLLYGTYCTITRKTVPSLQSSSNLGLPLKAFTYAELEKATSRFQEVLGTGASGIVYKGQLQDDLGTCIAVKKIDKLKQESEKEFTVEVQAIGQTHHKNLVRLLGYCNEGKERLLVYEFMSNGSLDRFLFGDVRLQWNLRVELILGVARGLLYLHEECSTQIIHCDIKPQNILLDGNFTAKISDFGLSKLLRTNQTQTNTGIRGTRGYVAPEWFKSIGITAKVDVYSFGVILLELICCRRNVELETAEEDQKILAYWANDCYRCGRVDILVEGDDEAISNLKVVERFVAVALCCLQEDPTMRPTMLKVTQMLDGAAEIPTSTDPSSFETGSREPGGEERRARGLGAYRQGSIRRGQIGDGATSAAGCGTFRGARRAGRLRLRMSEEPPSEEAIGARPEVWSHGPGGGGGHRPSLARERMAHTGLMDQPKHAHLRTAF